MNVLYLLEELGYHPKRASFTGGGEYSCSCPDALCGGHDRFRIWPEQAERGRYWCRVCDRKGDAIQFCRDYLGLSYREACRRVGEEPGSLSYGDRAVFVPSSRVLAASASPTRGWIERAESFVQYCHRCLLESPQVHAYFLDRGLSEETMREYQLGYCPVDYWDSKSRWGLDDDGKQVWLAKGMVIPSVSVANRHIQRVKVRRTDWNCSKDGPKYVEVSGSRRQPSLYGDPTLPVVLVEAELDALLVAQECRGLCCAIALGGVTRRPDAEIDELLRGSSKLLYSLDFDESGKREWGWWKRMYPKMVPWPAPVGKSPSEAFCNGEGLSAWICGGMA